MPQVWVQVIVLALALSCSSAHAQSSEYRTLTDAAVEEHALGHYAEARAMFAKAHALYPNARTLWGMGVASFEERLYVDAIRLLKEALAHGVKPLTAAQRKEAETLIERSSAYVVRVHIALTPAHARLTVDGLEVERGPEGEVELDVGEHQLVASAEGYAELSRAVRWAAGGEQPALEMHLVALTRESATRPPSAPSEAASSSAVPVDEGQPGRALNVLKWVSLGATVASLAVLATGFGLRQTAAMAYNDDDKCPTPKRETCTNLRNIVQRRELVGISGAAAAGAFSIVTIVAFVLAAKHAKRPSQASAACAPSVAPGVACSVRF